MIKTDLNRFKQIGILFVICHLSFVIFLVGCARTVTEKVAFGRQIIFEVNFRENIDTANKYYIILSTQEVKAPVRPATLDAFVLPGETPPAGSSSIEVYYQNYFSSWSGYLKNEDNSVFLIKGPFASSGESYSRERVGEIASGTNKIALNFAVSKVFSGAPARIYFNFIAVDPAQTIKYITDYLDSSRYINNYATSVLSEADETNSALGGSLDITSWKVELQ